MNEKKSPEHEAFMKFVEQNIESYIKKMKFEKIVASDFSADL
jgi:hypothetical protein